MEIKIRQKKSWWLYEWSLDGKKWYPIHERNVVMASPGERREIMNRAIQGGVQTLDGVYVREIGILALAFP